jgi:hypothetical protein
MPILRLDEDGVQGIPQDGDAGSEETEEVQILRETVYGREEKRKEQVQ